MMERREKRRGVVLACLLGLSLAREAAAESDNDAAAQELVRRAMKLDLRQRALGKKAKAQLDLAASLCKKQCSAPVRAAVAVGYGTVHAYAGAPEEAKKLFAEALRLDPAAKLVPGRDDPPVRDAFAAAAEAAKADKDKPALAPAKDTRRTVEDCEVAGKPPSGWKSHKAFCYYSEAVGAEATQQWAECIDYGSRSLDAERRAATRLLAGQCLERAGRWMEALREYRDAAAEATSQGQTETATQAEVRHKTLGARIPRLVLRAPRDVEGLEVTLDGQPFASERLGGEVWLDPGEHRVTAKGTVGGKPLQLDRTVKLYADEVHTLELTPAQAAASTAAMDDPRVQKCMLVAKTKEELAACLEESRPSPVSFTSIGEVSGYVDSDAVEVLTPGVVLAVESPTDGWGVGASFLVDVVTAASADIVATASPRWTELRYVPALNGHKRFGDLDLRLNAQVSVEPDYLAAGAGLGASLDLADKNVTPALKYEFGYDVSGRAGTPFDVFGNHIHRHAAIASVTLVLDRASILVPGATAVFELGDTSKPYRFVPTFAPETDVQPGETVDSVNAKRLPLRLADQLPTERQRYAVNVLYARRFSSVTLRADQRLYIDSWAVMATTTDVLVPWDVVKPVRLWPHLRFHAQSGAQFYELAYRAALQPDGTFSVPLLRTGDRELGPMLQGTAGAGARVGLDDAAEWGLSIKADAIYTRFLDHLFKQGRFGVFAALAMEGVFR